MKNQVVTVIRPPHGRFFPVSLSWNTP